MPHRDTGEGLTVAQVARGLDPGGDWLDPTNWPDVPKPPQGIRPRPPVARPLKVYAFGPSRGRTGGNIRTDRGPL